MSIPSSRLRLEAIVKGLSYLLINRALINPTLTSHPVPIAIEVAVTPPQQLLGSGKRADLLAGGLGPAGLGRLRAKGGRA